MRTVIHAINRLWIKCLTDKRYVRVTEAVVWGTMGILLGAIFLGASTNWHQDFPSQTPIPIPTPTEIPVKP
jgi:hypothetical protein